MPQKQNIINAITKDLHAKYPDKQKRELAEKCLHVGAEWAEKVQLNPSNEKDQRKKLKKECYNYIKQNVECVATGFIFTIVLVATISWITQKILNFLFDNFTQEEQ